MRGGILRYKSDEKRLVRVISFLLYAMIKIAPYGIEPGLLIVCLGGGPWPCLY